MGVKNQTITVIEEMAGQRLDMFVSSYLDVSRSSVTKLLKYDNILLNGKSAKNGSLIRLGDLIEVISPRASETLEPENIELDILYEDDDIAVINKKQGMTVHPGGGVYNGTLANAILYRYNSLAEFGGDRPGIVHRLDKDTSGVIVVALNEKSHANLAKQIADREVTKIYHALLDGSLAQECGEINTLIDRNPKERKLMMVSPREGRVAITRYQLVEQFENNCLVEFNILTGRTHQIRVHAKYMGNPVVGDKHYGYKKQRIKVSGQLLHAKKIKFAHPTTGKEMVFKAPKPTEFKEVIKKLRKEKEEN